MLFIATNSASAQLQDTLFKFQDFPEILNPYFFQEEDPLGEEDMIYALYDLVNPNFYNYTFFEREIIRKKGIKQVTIFNGEEDSVEYSFDSLGRLVKSSNGNVQKYKYVRDSLYILTEVEIDDKNELQIEVGYKFKNNLPISWSNKMFQEEYSAEYFENNSPKKILKVWHKDTIDEYSFKYVKDEYTQMIIQSLTDTVSYVYSSSNVLKSANIPPFEAKFYYAKQTNEIDSLIDSVQLIYSPLNIVVQTVYYTYNSKQFVVKVQYESNSEAVEQCCNKQYVDFANSFAIEYEYNKNGDVVLEMHESDFSTWRRRYVYVYRNNIK